MRRLYTTSLLIALLISFAVVIRQWRSISGKATSLEASVFIDGAMRGHSGVVESLLDQGISPKLFVKSANLRWLGDWEGPAVVAAAWEGHADIVEMLLKRGAHVDERARGYLTGIIGENLRKGSSRSSGQTSGCGMDYQSGVYDAAKRDNLGVTALMAAALRGHIDVVELEPEQRRSKPGK